MGTITALETIETPSINGGPIAGFRNAIINGNFNINQRGYVSGAATAVGQYTLDRWAVTNTPGLIFTSSENKTTVTIPAGQTIKQVIEGVNLQTGKYVLSWKGTAQGRVNGGSYGSSGLVVADVVGGVNTTIEFNAGTVTDVQFEPGRIATVYGALPWDVEEIRCMRYREEGWISAGGASNGSYGVIHTGSEGFKVSKRVEPSITYSNVTYTSGAGLTTGTKNRQFFQFSFTSTLITSSSAVLAKYVADAEIPI